VPELRRVAASLQADPLATFASPCISQVEGQMNRLKFLKRQISGRARLDSLRVRVLHPN
jgi:transposase